MKKKKEKKRFEEKKIRKNQKKEVKNTYHNKYKRALTSEMRTKIKQAQRCYKAQRGK